MGTLSHLYGQQNIANSINYLMSTRLGENIPDWMEWNYGVTQPRTLNFYFPDQPLNFPSFSVHHLGSDPVIYSEGDRADGDYRGIIRQGMFEVNCWVLEVVLDSKGTIIAKNEKWMSQLQQMRDMVVLLFEQNRSIPLYDFSDVNHPAPLNAILRIQDIREEPVVPDTNPAVRRVRILITYRWTERW